MDERKEAIETIAKMPPHSRTLLIGASDTGKTTFAMEAINILILRGRLPVAVVNSDIGQSEIGPPGVVGLGWLPSDPRPAPIRSLGNIPLVAGGFVGATSPAANPMEWVTQTAQMVNLTDQMHPRPVSIMIDTPGYVTGSGVNALRSLIGLIRPNLILAFASGEELEPIIRPLAMLSVPNLQILGVPVDPKVGRKTPAMRTTKRAARFAERFQGAWNMMLQWDSVVFENTTLSYGEAQLPHQLRFVNMALGGTCLYAEKHFDGLLTVVMDDSPPPTKVSNTGILEQHFHASSVAVAGIGRFNDLLCGLIGPKGDLAEIGIIKSMDFERRRLEITTRLKHPSAVAKIVLGYLRIKPDGREIGQVHPKQAI